MEDFMQVFIKEKLKNKTVKIICIAVMVLIVAVVGLVIWNVSSPKEDTEKTTIITQSTLEKVLEVSDLSLYKATYNGIAELYDDDNENVICHVSYEAEIKAGVDLQSVSIDADKKTKTVTVVLPQTKINEVSVDAASLDYMFLDDSKNEMGISAKAYNACIADAQKESKENKQILELANNNLKNVITALVKPFLQQDDGSYTLEIKEVESNG